MTEFRLENAQTAAGLRSLLNDTEVYGYGVTVTLTDDGVTFNSDRGGASVTLPSYNASAREAVAKGAAFLDQRVPGWRERIDTARLDLASAHECILGQIFAPMADVMDTDGYWLGRQILVLSTEECGLHGFTDAYLTANNSDLDKEWKRLLV